VPDYDAATTEGLLAAWPVSEVLVSSRYHALLVGAWRGSRLVAVHRNDKLAAAARSLGCVALERADDAGRVRAAIDVAAPVDREALHAFAAAARSACRAFADRLVETGVRVDAGSEHATGHVEFGPRLTGGGWHQAERDEISWFRWMGGQPTAWVDVTVPSGGANRLRCDVAHVAAAGIEKGVRLLIDGVPLATSVRRSKAGWTIDAEVSPLAAEGVVRVELVCRETIRPSDLNPPSPDTRRLAIAVRRIHLERASDRS
jgi:hypothetical protein